MKDYSKMSDREINKEVEKITGMYCVDCEGRYIPTCDYCNNPSDAWPIIDENKISVCFDDSMPSAYKGIWLDDIYGAVSDFEFESSDPKRLRAAMIVYLMMKDKEK